MVLRDVSNVSTTKTKKRKKQKTSNSSMDTTIIRSSISNTLSSTTPSLLEQFRCRDIKVIPDFSHVSLALEEAGHVFGEGTYKIPGGETFQSIDEYRSYLCQHGVALKGIKDRSAKKEERFQALMAWVCYHRVEKLLGGKDVSVITNRIDRTGLQKMFVKLGMMLRSNRWEIPGSDDRYDATELEDKFAQEGIDQKLVENSEMSREEHIRLELYVSCPFLRSNRNNMPFFKAAEHSHSTR